MTREEAIKGLTSLLEVRRKYCDMQTMKDEMESLEMAIKALEQQLTPKTDVLDEVRAEILNFKEKCNASDYLGCGILEIIDKYAESEDK